MLQQFIVAALGAMAGAYGGYLLAEHSVRCREQEDYLALLLIIYEHLAYLQGWLNKYDEQSGMAMFTSPLVLPDIKSEQVQRLMEVAFDKDMPRTLIHILYFWRNAAKGMMGGNAFYLSLSALENIKKQLKQELLSLQVQYEQERSDAKKFPPLEDSAV